MARRFDGLSAWVTGGGTGIGRALALELARRGASVAVSGRREDKLVETVRDIEQAGGKALALKADVTDEKALHDAVARAIAQYGKLDIAVANAGLGVGGSFDEITPDQWRRQLDINVMGTILTLRAALPEIRKTKGRLVVVSSVMGKLAMAGSAPYCTSKFALVGLCDTLWQELHGTGVTITNVMPGLVESDIARVNNEGVYEADAVDPRPARLMWKAEDAARAIADGIHKRPREFVFTGHGKFAAFAGQHFSSVVYPLMARLGIKSG